MPPPCARCPETPGWWFLRGWVGGSGGGISPMSLSWTGGSRCTSALRGVVRAAHHWSRRGIFDHCATLWGGWILTVPGGLRVYHAGDSAYGPVFAEIGCRYPDIDVAMVPVGAYAPRWFMQTMHMDPEEAVQAIQDLGARIIVPMHWGTFLLSREPALEPIERTRAAWADTDRARTDLWDLAVGESRSFRTATQA